MPTTRLAKNFKAFGVKQETTPNTAETIVAGDCFRAIDPAIEVADNPQDNPQVRTTRGKNKPIPGGKTMNVKFGVRVKGSGTAGTAPGYTDVYEAMGLGHTNVVGIADDYVLDDSDAPVTCQLFEGVTAGSTGKSTIVRGCALSGSWTLTPGAAEQMDCEGQGVFESDDDATVLAQTGEDSTDPPILVNADVVIGVHSSDSVEASDGVVEEIADGAASNIRLALKFTPAVESKVVALAWKFQKNGTPANETNGLNFGIQADDAGAPDGSDITNSAYTLATASIGDSAERWYWNVYSPSSRPTVEADDNWCVVDADYDPDADNNIQISTDAVAVGSQRSQFYDAAWAALSLKNICVKIILMPTSGHEFYFGETFIALNNEFDHESPGDDPNDAQGYAHAVIADCDPTIDITPRETLDSEYDLAELFDDQDEVFFHAQLGSTAGNIVQWIAEHCIVIEKSKSERGMTMVRNLKLRVDREIADCAGFQIRHS